MIFQLMKVKTVKTNHSKFGRAVPEADEPVKTQRSPFLSWPYLRRLKIAQIINASLSHPTAEIVAAGVELGLATVRSVLVSMSRMDLVQYKVVGASRVWRLTHHGLGLCRRHAPKNFPVRNLTTGEIFQTGVSARAAGYNPSAIAHVLSGLVRSHAGCKWERVNVNGSDRRGLL